MNRVTAVERAILAETNMLAALRAWAAAAEGGACEERAGALFARAAAPVRSFNNILIHDAGADIDAIAAHARAYFAGVGDRYRLRVRDDLAPLDDAAFNAAGLRRNGGIPSLSVALPLALAGAPAPRVDVRRVEDEHALPHHVSVIAQSFDFDPAQLARVFRPALIEQPAWRGYVAYDGDAPVATSQLVVTGDAAGVYYVATVEAARRRGCGEAVTRRALDDAAALGCAVASLQASPMGLPVYQRMGFEQVAYYRTYAPE